MGKYIVHMLLHLYPYLTKAEQEESARTLLYLVQCHALQLSQMDIAITLPSLVSFGGLKYGLPRRLTFRIDTARDLFPLETAPRKSSQPAPLVFSFKKEEPVQKAVSLGPCRLTLQDILVVDEPFEVELLLSNPFRFPLELDEMQLL